MKAINFYQLTGVDKMKMTFLLSLFFLNSALAESIPLCRSTQSVKEFVAKNYDILLIGKEKNGSIGVVVDSLKDKTSTLSLHSLILDRDREFERNSLEQTQQTFWGITSEFDEQKFKLDIQNCIPFAKKDEVLREIENWERENRSPLYIAAKKFDLNEIRTQIKKKSFKTPKNELDWGAFTTILYGAPELAIELLEAGFPLSDSKTRGNALVYSIIYSEHEVVRYLLKRKAHISYEYKKDEYGPITAAIALEDYKVLEMLLAEKMTIPKDAFCFMFYYQKPHQKKFTKDIYDKSKVAEILIDNDISINTKCGQDSSTAIGMLMSDEFVEAFKLARKKEKKIPAPWNFDYNFIFLKELWHTDPEMGEVRRKQYQSLMALNPEKLKSLKQNEIGDALFTSINFDEFDKYKMLIDHIKPNIQFKFKPTGSQYERCSTHNIFTNDKSSFLLYAYKSGLKMDSDCDGKGYNGYSEVLNELISRCSIQILKQVPENEIRSIKLDEYKLREMEWGTENCAKTYALLKKNGKELNDQKVIRNFLESDLADGIRFLIREKIVAESSLKASFNNFKSIESQFPVDNRGFQIRGIRREIINVFFSEMKKNSITPPEEINNKFNFKVGESYPLCSLEGDLNLITKKGGSPSDIILTDCLNVMPSKISYFEITDIEGEILEIVSTSGAYNQDKLPQLGSRFYVDRESVAPLSYVAIDGVQFPISYAGVNEIEIQKGSVSSIGSEDFCKGALKPKIVNASSKKFKFVAIHAMKRDSCK
jgi:hypothetical protein